MEAILAVCNSVVAESMLELCYSVWVRVGSIMLGRKIRVGMKFQLGG